MPCANGFAGTSEVLRERGRQKPRAVHTIPVVTAPVVVILAAGQGTRMRSSVQKLLHPLCGRPIIDWPIAAAREAGAGRIVIVDSPERPLESVTGDGVELAIQHEPRGTADAVKAAAGQIGADQTVVVINGDVPLVRPE